jgi:hypothetical protein
MPKKLRMLSLLAMLTVMSGCAGELSKSVALPPARGCRAQPDLITYSAEFQAKALEEKNLLQARPCAPLDNAPAGCSALRTMVSDYGTVRDQIRSVR